MKIKLNKKKLYGYFFIWQRFLVNKLIDIYVMIINYKNKSQKKKINCTVKNTCLFFQSLNYFIKIV